MINIREGQKKLKSLQTKLPNLHLSYFLQIRRIKMYSLPYLIYACLILATPAIKAADTDCSTDSFIDANNYINQIAHSLKQQLQTPPENLGGIFFSIEVTNNDPNRDTTLSDKDFSASMQFDIRNATTTLSDIEAVLNQHFKPGRTDLGHPARVVSSRWFWKLHAGPPQHQGLGDIETTVLAVRHQQSNSWTKSFGQGQCTTTVHTSAVWYSSKPVNTVTGTVTHKKDDSQLEKGVLRFTRLGPGNTQAEHEVNIEGGQYTLPDLSAGHYKIELLEPKSCAGVLDTNWKFLLPNASKNLQVECQSCLWNVHIEGKTEYLAFSKHTNSGKADFKNVTIEVDPDMDCDSQLPQPYPLNMQSIVNLEKADISSSGFVNNDRLFFDIKTSPDMSAFSIEFNAPDATDPNIGNETSIGFISNCGLLPIPPYPGASNMMPCSLPNALEKIKAREAFSFKHKSEIPQIEKNDYTISFTPVN